MTSDPVGNAARNLALLRFLVDTSPAHEDVDEQDDARDQALIQRQDAEEGR